MATIKFFDVLNPSLEKIGEVKSDPSRLSLRFTALDADGHRIKDCHTREEAETAIQEKKKE